MPAGFTALFVSDFWTVSSSARSGTDRTWSPVGPIKVVRFEVIRNWISQNATIVYLVGRNGMHKYNNQDHSMLTAILSAENVLGAEHDLWAVNVEEEYHEEFAK